MSTEQVCTNCHYVGRGKTPGSFFVEIVLWFMMILPGFLYTAWRVGKKNKMCPQCKSLEMIPKDSARAKKLLAE